MTPFSAGVLHTAHFQYLCSVHPWLFQVVVLLHCWPCFTRLKWKPSELHLKVRHVFKIRSIGNISPVEPARQSGMVERKQRFMSESLAWNYSLSQVVNHLCRKMKLGRKNSDNAKTECTFQMNQATSDYILKEQR